MKPMRQMLYWAKVLVVIATLSALLAVVLVYLEEKAGPLAALVAGIVLSPAYAWLLTRAIRNKPGSHVR